MQYRLEHRVRRFSGGTVLLGGDPTRLFRLGPAGLALVDRVLSGGEPRPGAETALVERLLAAGILIAEWAAADSPFTAADVSVVVPVRDDTAGLSRLLASLAVAARHDGSQLRVVVVDDGSAAPEEVVAAVEASGVDGTVLRRDTSGGPGVARNDGAAHVSTPLLAFLDADCVVHPGWLGPLLGHFADPAVAIAAPRVAPIPPNGPPNGPPNAVLSRSDHAFARSLRDRTGGGRGEGGGFVWGHDRVRSPLDLGSDPAAVRPGGRVAYVPSAAMLVRRDRFEELGGFDPVLRTGEDVDLVWRAAANGMTVRYEPAAVVDHDVRGDVVRFSRQRFSYGRSAAALDGRHPGDVAPARLSGWSAGIAALLLAGGPGVPAAAALAGWSAWRLQDRLDGVPRTHAALLGLGGHWSAVRQLLRSSLREWWPLLALAAPLSRRARRVLIAAAGVSLIDAALDGVDAASLPLVIVDDVAYGAGVWAGCWHERSWRALLPGPSRQRGRR